MNVSDRDQRAELGKYYIDLNRDLGEDFSDYRFDVQGIPLARISHQREWNYNPVTICQYGLFYFNKYWNDGSLTSKQIFLTQADWLVGNAENGVNGSYVWYYRFDLPFYNITAPWISGMAQGEALSMLLRAHQLTGIEQYLRVARNAWNIFWVSVDQGGVISYFPDGRPIIEEYPAPGCLTGVLNGFISAVFGLYDYAIYTREKTAWELFFDFIASLKNNLQRYDCGYWSYYDLKPPFRLASQSYHRLHIEQLRQLYNITLEQCFAGYQERWGNYLFSLKSNMKWTMRKIYDKFWRD